MPSLIKVADHFGLSPVNDNIDFASSKKFIPYWMSNSPNCKPVSKKENKTRYHSKSNQKDISYDHGFDTEELDFPKLSTIVENEWYVHTSSSSEAFDHFMNEIHEVICDESDNDDYSYYNPNPYIHTYEGETYTLEFKCINNIHNTSKCENKVHIYGDKCMECYTNIMDFEVDQE